MFFSKQLLNRKAPLGQIWMAATTNAKMSRKTLNKLDIVQICEEILNPSVPMALRLSGILMGGVVNVYERKVNLLFDDANRLLVEINKAWKKKAAQEDPTVLPKGKLQARRQTVTLPEIKEKDVAEMEQSLGRSNSTTAETCYQPTAFFAVSLDDIDDEPDAAAGNNEDPLQHCHHQADPEDITLPDSYQGNMEFYNQYERFGDVVWDDEEIQMHPTQIPTNLVPSPPHHTTDDLHRDPIADQVQEQYPEHKDNQQYDEYKEAKQHEYQLRPKRVRRKRQAASIMDDEQIMIPGHEYRSWLENTSDIISRRGKQRKACKTLLSSMKIPKLMDLTSVVLMDDVLRNGIQEIHYPAPLMELYMKSNQPRHNSPSAAPPAHVENVRTNQVYDNGEIPIDNSNGEIPTPGDEMNSVGSIQMKSAGSIPDRERSNKKRPYSSSGGCSLDPVAEEHSVQHPLSRLSEKDQSTEQEMLVETGPTPTQFPVVIQPVDKMTETIRMQMKTHFETPGAPREESLNNLAAGMDRKGAARLFYQTCVLATNDYLKVEQKVPFGDILISKGQKM